MRKYIPEGLFDAAHVVQLPILLGDVLLADRDTGPRHAQLGDTVDIVLVEVDLEGTEVFGRPLSQAPLLNDLLGGIKLDVLADDVTVEDGELAADLSAIELARRTAGEGGDALGVGEGVVELLGGRTHLVRGSQGGGVHGNLAGGRGGGGCGRSILLLGALGVDGGLGEAGGWVDARGVLEVLCVFGDQLVGELGEGLTELRQDLRPDEVLYGLLGCGIGVVLNLELWASRTAR